MRVTAVDEAGFETITEAELLVTLRTEADLGATVAMGGPVAVRGDELVAGADGGAAADSECDTKVGTRVGMS